MGYRPTHLRGKLHEAAGADVKTIVRRWRLEKPQQVISLVSLIVVVIELFGEEQALILVCPC